MKKIIMLMLASIAAFLPPVFAQEDEWKGSYTEIEEDLENNGENNMDLVGEDRFFTGIKASDGTTTLQEGTEIGLDSSALAGLPPDAVRENLTRRKIASTGSGSVTTESEMTVS